MPGQDDILWKGRGVLDKCKEVLVHLTLNEVSHPTKLGMAGTYATPKEMRVFRVLKLAIVHSDSLGYCNKDAELIPLDSIYFCLVILLCKGYVQ